MPPKMGVKVLRRPVALGCRYAMRDFAYYMMSISAHNTRLRDAQQQQTDDLAAAREDIKQLNARLNRDSAKMQAEISTLTEVSRVTALDC